MKTISQLKLKRNEINSLMEIKQNLLATFPNAQIILYGSKARGDSNEFSDIDILILLESKITTKVKESITAIVYEFELKYDVICQTTVENRDFWNSSLANVMPLHLNVEKEGVVL